MAWLLWMVRVIQQWPPQAPQEADTDPWSSGRTAVGTVGGEPRLWKEDGAQVELRQAPPPPTHTLGPVFLPRPPSRPAHAVVSAPSPSRWPWAGPVACLQRGNTQKHVACGKTCSGPGVTSWAVGPVLPTWMSHISRWLSGHCGQSPFPPADTVSTQHGPLCVLAPGHLGGLLIASSFGFGERSFPPVGGAGA